MSLFFYRPWAGEGEADRELGPANPIYYTRWGYAALFGITMALGLVMNFMYLIGYVAAPRAWFQVPHVCLVWLCVRDILVCLVLIPTAIDWLVVNLSMFSGGAGWCGAAAFFDYFLHSVYPMLLLVFVVILYSRKLPEVPVLPGYGQVGQADQQQMLAAAAASSRMSARSGYTQQQPQRPPSVTGSLQSSRSARHDDFRKGFSKTPSRPGSVAGGSIDGRGRPASVQGSLQGARRPNYNQSLSVPAAAPLRSSSPLGMVEEEGYPASLDGSDLWDAASLDYPGREDAEMMMDEDMDPEEPRLREWLAWVAHGCWLAALGFGIPAALMVRSEKAPGCYVYADPFKNPYNYAINDPGFNFLMSSVILTYLLPGLVLLIMAILLFSIRWTQDGKLNRFMKLGIALVAIFLVARSPIDIIQFKDIIYAAQGFKITNLRPDELEHEVLLIWAALIPVVANPVVYLSCVTEYRQNISQAWKIILGKKEKDVFNEEKMTSISAQVEERSTTKMSSVL